YVANEGPNGRIHRFQKSTSGWIEENFAPGTPTNTIMSGSDITIIPNGQIFFVGTDNRTHNYWFDGSSWYEATLNTNAPQNVSKYLASDDLGNVFYNSLNVGGSGNRIYVNYWGCSEVFKSTEINSSAEGSNENDQNSALALFPNPNTGDFHIRFKKQDGSPMITIHVFDIMGHMVYNESVENWTGDHSMNLSGLPNGTYMLRIISQDKSFTNRFVVLK
ncbi:MAG TPA: T9SS type A sorting domain-containing protein, partial [Bacteroidales bacterium]|nr:T9SS type A sorting domain-containing protein [Bacteroidales bacterium]